MRPEQKKVGSILGLVAGVVSAFSGRSRKPTSDDLSRADFKASTQRIGVRFTDRIRNVFRNRWLKRS
jgi:hypothetical protein